MILVIRFLFLSVLTGDDFDKMQMLSGFDNKCRVDDHCTNRN
jgi:hypothetical protein